MIKTLVLLASAAVLVFAGDEPPQLIFGSKEVCEAIMRILVMYLGCTDGEVIVVTRAAVRLDAMGISGNISFTAQPDGNLRVTGTIVGMPPGMYGFHVHEKGDLAGGCGGAGAHFNPNGKDHGHPEDENRHVGDLGNIEFDMNGVAHLDFADRMIKLHGRHNIIGRAVVLHEKHDDFGRSDHPDSKKTGNAGGRVACGVIGIA